MKCQGSNPIRKLFYWRYFSNGVDKIFKMYYIKLVNLNFNLTKIMEHYTDTIVEKTFLEKEKQIEGAKQAFNLAFDEYCEKNNGDLPDLTESSVVMFVQNRPEMNRALNQLKLIRSTDWPEIALEVLKERIMDKKD